MHRLRAFSAGILVLAVLWGVFAFELISRN